MIIKITNTFQNLLEDINESKEPLGFFAGGTNIMLDLKRDPLNQKTFYNLDLYQSELKFVKNHQDTVEIGALVSLTDLINSVEINEFAPHLVTALETIGNLQVRNMATLIGNVANASSVGDSLPVLLTRDATLCLISVVGERLLHITDFFLDNKKTALRSNEMIKSIIIPKIKISGKYKFFKSALRPSATISKVNLSFEFEDDHFKLATGGVSKTPIRLYNLESILSANKGISKVQILEILKKETSPINDIRSTASYRLKVLSNLIYNELQTVI